MKSRIELVQGLEILQLRSILGHQLSMNFALGRIGITSDIMLFPQSSPGLLIARNGSPEI